MQKKTRNLVILALLLASGLGWGLWEYRQRTYEYVIVDPGGDDRVPPDRIPYWAAQRLYNSIIPNVDDIPVSIITKNFGGKYPKGYAGVGQLDFTLPTEEGFGDNPSWEVFKVPPGTNVNQIPFDRDEFLRFGMLSEQSKLYFTLGNRWQNATSHSIPTAIISYIPDKACIQLNKNHNPQGEANNPEIRELFASVGDIPIMRVTPNLTPYSEPVSAENVVDIPYSTGCFKGADGVNYFIVMSRAIAIMEYQKK